MKDRQIAAAAGIPAILALIALLVLSAPALFAAGAGARGQAQSLAELAKKEKARREALKGKKASVVVTNAELAKMTKTAAIETPPETPPAEAGAAGTDMPGRATAGEQTAAAAGDAAAGDAAAAPETHSVTVEAASGQPGSAASRAELEAKLSRAQEYVELLTLKMNALWQQFYAPEDPTPKDLVQQQIAETYERLIQAQDEAVKAKALLDAAAAKTRTDVPSIWIR